MDVTLERITNFLLRVETFKDEKAVLTEKLDKKWKKWQEIDHKFKERKQTLLELMQVGIVALTNIGYSYEK